MAVIINEFEVVLDPPTEQETTAEIAAAAPRENGRTVAPLTPHDLEWIARHCAARIERVRAH